MSTGNGNIKNFKKNVPYEQIPRELLQACDTNSKHNKNLSLQAIGLLCNIRSYAESWDLHKTELYKRYAKNKEASVRRAWDELVANDYIVQLKRREGNKYKYIYYVTVYPFTEKDIKEIEKKEGAKTVKDFSPKSKKAIEQENLDSGFSRPQIQDLNFKTSKPRAKREQIKDITNKDITNEKNGMNGVNDIYGEKDVDNILQSESHSNHSQHDNNTITLDFNEYMRLKEHQRSIASSEHEEDIKYAILEQFPERLKHYIMNFTLTEVELLKDYILIGKTSYNDSVAVEYRLTIEDIEFELINMLKRVKRKMYEKQETVEQLRKYIIKSTKKVFMNVAEENKEEYIDFSNIDTTKFE
ncbi:hypothetical protein [Staphylococcus gallinarum]|uniref:hypothetical protein n=1 Tax=Staphylococcus gallinarum TaxID=1293 RepID=UPI002DBD1F2A|nr:hypothetical protein [Staphylococcus gallinarum]MEB6279119.1 hypothetical protein [Staphylococcus gallinarum]